MAQNGTKQKQLDAVLGEWQYKNSAEAAKKEGNMGEKRIWYAVMETPEDDWSCGSYDFQESKEMLRKQGKGRIAMIEDNACEKEMFIEDLFADQFYYYMNPNAGTDYNGDECFELYRGINGADGKHDRDTEVSILRAAYVDVPGYDECFHTYVDDKGNEFKELDESGRLDDVIDKYVFKALGFSFDYEIG